MRRRDHGAPRLFQVSDREVQGVRGDEPDVQNIRPGLGHAPDKSVLQRLAREAHVASYNYARARQPQETHIGPPDLAGHVSFKASG
jgi:hypothetical protein